MRSALALPCVPPRPATVAAIVATAREPIACNNAGEFPRVFGFSTDDLLREAFGDPVATAQAAAACATPPVLRTELLAVRRVRVLADGRIGVVMED